MGPFANSFPRWRLWPIQVLGEDRPTGMTADLEALVADWIGVTPGGNRADCTARRRCSSASSRSRPRVPRSRNCGDRERDEVRSEERSCRPLRDISGVGPQASLGRVDQRQGRSHEGRTRPTGRRAPLFCVRA
jgi:hypothetical protein